ncbi:MAG: HAD family hydrolase [Campylobacteraceae bacterium]|nr:HAD family hydrolase [Campylobacteraceae bacterium]
MKVILFDLDGTLIDSTEAILESFDAAFNAMKKESPEPNYILELIGHPLDEMFKSLGVPKSQVWEYVDAYKLNYRLVSKPKTTFLPTAKEAIVLAHKHAILGVVTTKTSQYSKELLEHMGVMNYFEVLIGREDVINPKPDPEPILKAMHALGAHKEKSWMIGDTCMDMVAAKKAGIKSVAVSCGYSSKEQLKKCALYIEPTPLDAVEKILE